MIVAIVLIFTILVAGVQLFGLGVYTVLSPSMEPEYKTGALLYVKKVDPQKLKVGDVITFMVSRETTVTHRIVEISRENDGQLYFKTKGDANKTADAGSVNQNNILGKPVFDIPYLGYVAGFITQPPGMYLGIAVGVILTILVFMLDYIAGDEPQKTQEGENENEKK